MSNENKKLPELEDCRGGKYQLTKVLNQGGQGVIYKTAVAGVLIKGFTNQNEIAKKRWRDHIQWLIRQDIAGLKLARPLILLKEPRTGYVMELMDGLVSLKTLLESYVKACDSISEENPFPHIQDYIDEGGLSRRIRILSQLARTLNQLHGKGMLYGDISLDNIFVSDDPHYAETWLIDCDNISLESHCGFSVHTPDYGAPEVVKGEAMLSSLTDCWSFAVVAYQLLTHNHPLKGDSVNYGDPEREESALRGEIPWINDLNNKENQCSDNLPIQLMEHSKLPHLFEQTFGIGKTHPIQRPTMAEWLEALTEIEESLHVCQHCQAQTMLPTEGEIEEIHCFFCDAKADENLVLFEEFIYLPEEEKTENYPELPSQMLATGRRVYIQPNDQKELKRLMPSLSYDKIPTDNIKIEYTDNQLILDPMEPLHISRGTENIKLFSKKIKLEVEKRGANDVPYRIHLGDHKKSHVFWQFRW